LQEVEVVVLQILLEKVQVVVERAVIELQHLLL
jgi:hypothetical protein